MTQSVVPAGPLGPPGPQGPTGATGAPGATVAGSTLAAQANIGATSITLSSSLLAGSHQGYVAIEPYTTNCEIRKVAVVSGVTIGLGTFLLGTDDLEKAHPAGTPVLHFTEDSVPAYWFGCRGDGSTGDTGTDDSVALQWAMYQTGNQGLWLHGQNRVYMISIPMLLAQSGKIKHLNLRPKSVYAPVDPTNAMLMNMQGYTIPFTGSASTDRITATNHSLPGTDSLVLFKGTSMPGGVVAGRVYYVRDITSTTFKISETLGGTALNITSDGSGTVYTEVLTLQKVYIDDVYLSGRGITGMNGVALSLQQPTYIRKLRVDFCNTGTGLTVSGQQAVFENFEAIQCGTGLALEGASFMWFYATNFEQFVDRGLHIRRTPLTFIQHGNNGASNCFFVGMHIEMLGGSASRVAFDYEGGSQNVNMFGCNISMSNIAGQRAWWIHSPLTANDSSYTIRGVVFNGLSGVAGNIAIQDDNRGQLLDAWDDFRFIITDYVAPILPSSDLLMPDPGSVMIPRVNGGYIRSGAQTSPMPSMQIRPASNQLGEQTLWRDKTGVKASGVNKDGYYTTQRHTAPADADLVAGELAIWFDQTNGAAKAMFKCKEAGGTVRTGSVTLT